MSEQAMTMETDQLTVCLGDTSAVRIEKIQNLALGTHFYRVSVADQDVSEIHCVDVEPGAARTHTMVKDGLVPTAFD